MRNWRRTSLVAAGAITSGMLLTYDVRATEWLVAQAPQPSQLEQPSDLERPSGLEQPSGLTTPPRNTRPRIRRSTDRNRTQRESRTQRNRSNRFNRRSTDERRIPVDPVPFPEQLPRRRATQPQRTIPRIPNSFPSPLTGISGQIVIAPICSVTATASECVPRPYQGTIKVMPISRDRAFTLSTDPQGLFQARLDPGVYIIQPESNEFPAGTSQTVTVVEGMMRSTRIDFQGYRSLPPQTPGQITRTAGQPFPQGVGQNPQPPGGQALRPTQPQVLPNGFLRF